MTETSARETNIRVPDSKGLTAKLNGKSWTQGGKKSNWGATFLQ